MCVFSMSNFAQTSIVNLSNAEIFLKKSGRPIQVDKVDVGDLTNSNIWVEYYSDLNTNTKISVFVFNSHQPSFTLYIDSDDIIGLLKCVKLISNKPNPTKDFVIKYHTRAGHLFEFNNWRDGVSANVFKNAGGWNNIPSADFNSFSGFLEKAKSILIFPEVKKTK